MPRFRLDFYRGKISPTTKVPYDDEHDHTTIHAFDSVAARQFGEMRRPGLIVVVTPAPKREKKK